MMNDDSGEKKLVWNTGSAQSMPPMPCVDFTKLDDMTAEERIEFVGNYIYKPI